MRRLRRRCPPSTDSSGESEYAESEGDRNAGSDTNLTDAGLSLDEDDEDGDGDKEMGDVEDQASLFADGTHPPEYYLRQLEAFDEVEYTKEDYKDSSTRLLDRIEEQWNQYVVQPPHPLPYPPISAALDLKPDMCVADTM